MTTLQEKLDNLDVIFELAVAKNPLFYYEKQHLLNRKNYIFKYFTVNEATRKQKIAEVNKALEGDAMLKDMAGTSAKLKAIDEEIEFKEYVEFGSVKAFIEKNELVIKVETESHNKEFRFKEDEYLDNVVNFIQKEVGEEAKKLSIRE